MSGSAEQPDQRSRTEHTPPAVAAITPDFVVGIGASAGGLEAMTELLEHLPDLSRIALVIVQHMDPHHESHLVDLLGRATKAPVRWAKDGEVIEPRNVYVLPPHICAAVRQRVFVFGKPESRSGHEINYFFRSLAEDVKDSAIGILLSGNGADGVTGLRTLKAHGGFVFAQDPATAKFPAMPNAAINAQCVDRTLAPADIAKELTGLTQDSQLIWQRMIDAGGDDKREQLTLIFRLLAARTGVDFSEYKEKTIERRLARRMLLTKVERVPDYVKLLHMNRLEVQQLYDTLLINVTEFFREPDTFEFLARQILPALIKERGKARPIRIWVPGCSTGEEPYSLAILLREAMEAQGTVVPMQIFATDVSETAIATARAGHYTPTEVTGVSPERLQRFFSKTDEGYLIQKNIRDVCVFARQNVVRDSPFSRLDLISCRNLLIYLGAKLQRKLMAVFHYGLNPDGHLMLGSSESVGSHVDLFRLVDRRFRIYARKSTSRRPQFDIDHEYGQPGLVPAKPHSPAAADDMKDPFDIIREADRIVLHRLGPTGVLVNEELEILQFRGDVSPYLAPISGRATLNLLKMAREGLAEELQLTVQMARDQNFRVFKKNVPLVGDAAAKLIDIDVTPIDAIRTKERFFLVIFSPAESEAAAVAPTKSADAKPPVAPQIDQLRQDLQATRSYLQATIERHELTNQELRAANEEIQSSNEELQSTNEELETAKEELQSTNEELTTVNEELHSRQLDLVQANNDLHNLINSVQLPIVILGQDMRIRRFTPMAENVLNLIPTDVGRPLSDINIGLEIKNLPRLVQNVIDSLVVKELEVQDAGNRWFSLRVRPYKTADNKIDGVVLTLIDVDAMKRTLAVADEARQLAQTIIETARDPMVVLTPELHVKMANDAFYELFKTTRERAEDRSFFDAVNEPEKLGELRRSLEGILPTSTSLTNHSVSIDLPGTGRRTLVINVRQVASHVRAYPLILLSILKP